ncbi:unnamed protein product [Peniophora sp. CBMAI 1063]|nr:unnamed protein product [Peniophora sp. CBMAI 1063]
MEFSRLLLEGPSSAIEHLRALYASREPPSLLEPQGELVLAMSDLAHELRIPQIGLDGVQPQTADAKVLLGGELWRACISSELIILLLEMIKEPSFSKQPTIWIVNVLTCLAGLLSAWCICAEPSQQAVLADSVVPNQRQLHLMFALLRPTWKNLWTHIGDFLSPRCNVAGAPGIVLGLLVSISGDMQILCDWYRDSIASTEQGERELLDVDFIPVIVFAWTHAVLRGGRGNTKFRDVPTLLQEHRTFVARFNESHPPVPGDSLATIRWNAKFDAVFSRLDPLKIMEAFRLVLERCAWLVDEYLVSHMRELYLLLSPDLDHHIALRRAFWAQPMLAALHAIIVREAKRIIAKYQGAAHWLAGCKCCCDLLGVVGEGAARGLCSSINGRHAGFLLGNFCTASINGVPAPFASEEQYETLDELRTSLRVTMARWCEAVEPSTNDVESSSDVNRTSIKFGLYSWARGAWYATLESLRDLKEKRDENEHSPRVIQCWLDLGNALRLDEHAERIRYQETRARLCSWSACVYHEEHAQGALALCKGCGEARYCSRACQRRDWKEGGHKAKCRRVKS